MPVGCLASESKNRVYKQGRQIQARKNSRTKKLMETIARLFNKRASQQKTRSLTPDVIELLESSQCFASSNDETSHNFSFDDDSDDSASENINLFSFEVDVENN